MACTWTDGGGAVQCVEVSVMKSRAASGPGQSSEPGCRYWGLLQASLHWQLHPASPEDRNKKDKKKSNTQMSQDADDHSLNHQFQLLHLKALCTRSDSVQYIWFWVTAGSLKKPYIWWLTQTFQWDLFKPGSPEKKQMDSLLRECYSAVQFSSNT